MPYGPKEHEQKVAEFQAITKDLTDLYNAKNIDYGDSFGQSFQKWGLPMSCIRLGDKLNRLESFAKGQDMKVKDESVKDTLRDIANYAIMTLIEINREESKNNG